MSIEICRDLWNKEKELKKNSIYLLGDDENDRGFEFFVLIDPDDPGNRPPFLKELHNVVINGEKVKDFIEPNPCNHKGELKKWLGTNTDDDLYPINWLKIAIERYPYRLFVVIDENNWSKDSKSPLNGIPLHNFLKKRICWISKEEFKNRIYSNNGDANAELEIYKLWLYTKWIKHVVTEIREIEGINCIHFFFNERESKEKFYVPDTLPGCFRAEQSPESEKIDALDTEQPLKPPDIELTFDCQFKKVDQKINDIENKIIIYYERHGDFYRFKKSVSSWHCFHKTLSKNVYYSENLSGSLSYFNQVYDCRSNINEYKAKFLFLKLAEQALFRIGIVDERFQDWWGQLPVDRAGSLHQSRIKPIYLIDQNNYGQKIFPSHGFYSKLIEEKKDDKHKQFKMYDYPNVEAESIESQLWPGNQRGLDMIMIHQGILDKWKENNKTKEALTSEILDLKELVPFVIITSGRGEPENLPGGIKYLGFSGLEACMVGTHFEKLSLMRQAMILL
jgi:hypothetical protein